MSVTLLVTLIILATVALIGGIAYAVHRYAAKRQAALAKVALQAGWRFAADPGRLDIVVSSALPLFNEGRERRAYNVMKVSTSPAVTVFDYEYTVGSGRAQSTIVQTVLHVRKRRLALPAFALAPENILHKVGTLFGYHDIDFDSSPEFSRKYLLRSKEEEERVRGTFSPDLRAYLEQRPPTAVEGVGDELVVYRQGRRVKPGDLHRFVDDALTVARQFEQ